MKTLTSLVALHGIHWAMEARTALQLWQELQSTSITVHMAEVEAREPRSDSGGDREYGMEDGGIAVISLCGPMTKATTSMSSGCSTVAVRRQVRAAAADPDVRAIMLRVDSPGGSVSGTADLAEDVRNAAKKKPVMGYAEDLCCSAALWVWTQCGTCIANSTAMVGSIGTYCAVADYSGMFEAAGVKVHLVSTGDYKGAGAAGVPITPDQVAEWQREVNELNAHFLSAVSRGRSMSMAEVKAIADGRVFVGQHARALGLADGIGSFDQAMADLKASVGTTRQRAEHDDRFAVALVACDTSRPAIPTATVVPMQTANLSPVSDRAAAERELNDFLNPPAEALAEAIAPEQSGAPPITSAEADQPEPSTPNADEANRNALRRAILGSLAA
jgi:signal peptide peptidase SppA